MIEALRGWTSRQKHVVAASYLGWTLDAMDFFLLIFVFNEIAAEFGTTRGTVALATTLTLAFRPLGAFIFGRLADHFGRRPILMLNIAIYSVFSASTAFVHDLTTFFVVRSLFGIGMGGVMLLLPVAWADYFGRESYGAIRGVALSLQVVAQAVGPVLSGVLRDLTGTYTLSLSLFAALAGLAALAVLAARSPTPPRPAAA